MRLGICSFSFHRSFASGGMDAFGYIAECARVGCTQLDPWNVHLLPPARQREALEAGKDPSRSHQWVPDPEPGHIDRVAEAARAAGLPFGTIAVDGAHVYEPSESARGANRRRADLWLDVARRLGATQVRIDAGGPEALPEDAFRIIVEGYRALVARARPMGIEILIENHWGSSTIPANVERFAAAAAGLGVLYDTRNWKPELRDEGRRRCAPLARATHVKVRRWDADGHDLDDDVATAVGWLSAAGYRGTWGVESVPEDADEFRGVHNTLALLRRMNDRRDA